MQGEGAHKGEAIDISKVDFAAKQEEGAEEEEEEDRAREVGVVHYMWWNWREGGEDCEGLHDDHQH